MSDLIDRQAAIDAVQEELNKQERSRLVNIWTTAEVRFTIVELILKQLPTAEPRCYLGSPCEYQNAEIRLPTAEPKTGRWKSDRLVSTNGGTYGVRRCSECEACYQDIGYGWNYCPNCGAKMEGEEE